METGNGKQLRDGKMEEHLDYTPFLIWLRFGLTGQTGVLVHETFKLNPSMACNIPVPIVRENTLVKTSISQVCPVKRVSAGTARTNLS